MNLKNQPLRVLLTPEIHPEEEKYHLSFWNMLSITFILLSRLFLGHYQVKTFRFEVENKKIGSFEGEYPILEMKPLNLWARFLARIKKPKVEPELELPKNISPIDLQILRPGEYFQKYGLKKPTDHNERSRAKRGSGK